MNCARLERLSFPAGLNASLLVSDLYQKLIVTVYQDDHATRLLFPEYAYEFEDIVMPRQFRTITYGSGGRYRECIGGNGIDLDLYDQLFRVAKLEESPETVTPAGPVPAHGRHRSACAGAGGVLGVHPGTFGRPGASAHPGGRRGGAGISAGAG